MMMIYGMFVFELRTLPHQRLQQNKSWRHVKMNALTVQQAGSISVRGDDRIVLFWCALSANYGWRSVAVAADHAGVYRTPRPLIDGVGRIYGMYVLTETNTTRSEFDRCGKAKKIEFSLTLERCDEDLQERLQSSSFSDILSGFKDKVTSSLNSAASSVKGLF
ncbi:phage tail protein [Escherichia coli]|nr:phage tail protein [Escherichia coli]